MTTEAVDPRGLTRRTVLKGSVAAVAFPTIVPASALARGGVAPSEKITLRSEERRVGKECVP